MVTRIRPKIAQPAAASACCNLTIARYTLHTHEMRRGPAHTRSRLRVQFESKLHQSDQLDSWRNFTSVQTWSDQQRVWYTNVLHVLLIIWLGTNASVTIGPHVRHICHKSTVQLPAASRYQISTEAYLKAKLYRFFCLSKPSLERFQCPQIPFTCQPCHQF